MAILATTGDIVEMVLKWRDTTLGEARTVLGFQAQTNLADWVTLASTFKTNFIKSTSGGILDGHPSSTSIYAQDILDILPGTRATYTNTFTPVAGGDTGTDLLPGQNTLVVTWRTGSKGRSYRGRTFLPFFLEGSQAGGAFLSGYTNAAAGWALALKNMYGSGGTDGDWRLVIISRYHNKVKRVTPVATQVTDYAVRNTVYSQRRRQLGRGI